MLLAVVRFDARQAASTVSYTVLIFMLFLFFFYFKLQVFQGGFIHLVFLGYSVYNSEVKHEFIIPTKVNEE